MRVRGIASAAAGMVTVACAAWLAAPEPSFASRGDYVGNEACGACHAGAFAAWKNSAHSRASESLGKRVTDRRCLACHSTGEAPAGRPYYSGVGCESCHGAGAGYSPEDIMRDPELSRLVGLRDLSQPKVVAELCSGCHASATRLTPFDAARAWKRIAH